LDALGHAPQLYFEALVHVASPVALVSLCQLLLLVQDTDAPVVGSAADTCIRTVGQYPCCLPLPT